jgi:DNA-binding GntR family transcriptional regulator
MGSTSYIFEELKRRIIEVEYKPGELLNERALIEEFKVSRTPIREALLKLSHLDLVKIVPRAGTYVAEIDIKSVIYAYELKTKLDALSAELASKRITESEIEELEDIAQRIKTYDSVKDYKECILDDQLFHKKIREASKNPLLIEYLNNLNDRTARFLQHIQYVVKEWTWYNKSLLLMIEAIKKGDAVTAGREAEKHVEVFLKELSEHFFRG